MLKFDVAEKIRSAIPGVTEGVFARAFVEGELEVDVQVGETYRYYDWASLTKIVFTVSRFMQLYEQDLVKPKDKVVQFLPWYRHKSVTVAQLLSHSSGHKAWNGYFEKLILDSSRDKKSFSDKIAPLLVEEELMNPGISLYSDISFLLLGCIMEAVTKKGLLEQWTDLNKSLGLRETAFHVNNMPLATRTDYAPTEECLWRKRKIQGEVHDDNTWTLGGVSSHAGLFGSMTDLTRYGLLLRSIWQGKDGFVKSSTLKFFAEPTSPKKDWALGFMMPSKPKSSSGKYFSKKSIGHTGFTGTSLWFDPEKDFLVVILSNRTYPDRNNFRFRDELRPLIHDWIYEAIEWK